MLEDVKKRVFEANLELVRKGLVLFTWGNVSEIVRELGLVVIKPSGVDYDSMSADDMVVVDLETGRVVEGECRPSTDTPTHLEIYKRFPEIGSISHTHSVNAVAFAQAGVDIPALGTTHADTFNGDIPCTRELTEKEVSEAYEKNTGRVIIEEVEKRGYNVMSIPGIIVKNHGPFSWGRNVEESVYHSAVMEVVAQMDIKTLIINKSAKMEQYILDKHYSRKHGPKSYYGQNINKKNF